MALVVQNDTGSVTTANAYITVDEFKAYHDARGNDYSSAGNDTQIEFGIIKASDYIDGRFSFIGRKLNGRPQTTQWPRVNAFDRDRYYINGIPKEVKEACAEYALRALSVVLNPDPERDDTGRTIQSKSETVGPLSESVTYVGVFKMPKYPEADQRLVKAGLTESSGQLFRG